MKIFSFSLCLFTLIFALSNQFIKNNKLRNLDDEKNIIEIEITGAEGEVTFINNDYDILDKIAKIIVNGEEMTEKKNSISVNANENYTITIQFQNGYEEYCPYMFSRLYKIKKIKFKNFKGCTNTESMFNQCSSLESLDLSSFDTSKVTNMRAMFAGCSSLKFLDLTSFDTSNVNSMEEMFAGCSSLESLDLSSFNTSKATNMAEMFSNCYYLYELVLSSSFTMEKVANYGNMFSNYYISVTQNGANLKEDIKNSIDSTNKKNLILITINTEESKNLKFINYDGTENIIMLQNDAPIDFTNNINVNAGMTVIKLLFPEDSNKISCEGLFKNIPEITKIAFINFDICNNAKEMFSGCSNLEKLNLKLFATSEITDMNGMFSGCSNLKTLGVSSFDISKSEDVDNMFCGCEKLTDIEKNSFGRTSFKCDDCDASKPFLIEYTTECITNCGDSYYSID
jgi:surface protein